MVTSAPGSTRQAASNVRGHRIEGIRFDRVMMVLCAGFVSGLYLDGWAHAHGKVDRTFFTPWHAVLYSSYFLCALTLVVTLFLNHRRGYRWQEAIPRGYGLALLGVPLFLLAGGGDLIWHTLFGFEVGIEPLLSPTHLLLAFSGILILAGPLRSAWLQAEPRSTNSWTTLLPAILSLIAVFSVFSFFTEFAHPFVDFYEMTNAFGNGDKSWGAASILLQAAIFMGFVLYALRRWRLPLGTLTLVFTANAALMSVFRDQQEFIIGALLTGIVADLLLWKLKPSSTRPGALRLFAFTVPLLYYLCYFVTLMLTMGITWSIHLWLGSCVMAGIVGLMLSYVLIPAPMPVEQE